MNKWLAWLRRRRKDWPIIISLVVFCLNIELVVTPRILKGLFGLSGRDLRIAAGSWSSVELCWWIWFSIWLFKEKIRTISSVNEAINVGQELLEDFSWQRFLKPKSSDTFPIKQAKVFALKHIHDFDIDRYQEDRGFMALFRFAKSLGYMLACILVFIFGLMPLFWIFGLMICRLVQWRVAYAALFISNFLKNYFLAMVYEEIGFWWLLAAFILMVMAVSFVVKRGMNTLRSNSKI